MDLTDLLQLALPVLISIVVLGVTVAIYKLRQESRNDAREWNSRSRTLHCPYCGAAYEEWFGETWGVDAEPPGFDCDGVVLVCGQCDNRGYVREHDTAFKVFPSIEAACEINVNGD